MPSLFFGSAKDGQCSLALRQWENLFEKKSLLVEGRGGRRVVELESSAFLRKLNEGAEAGLGRLYKCSVALLRLADTEALF